MKMKIRNQKCSQYDSNGKCNNPAELLAPGMPLDFCVSHNEMEKNGIKLQCSRCGNH